MTVSLPPQVSLTRFIPKKIPDLELVGTLPERRSVVANRMDPSGSDSSSKKISDLATVGSF